MAIVSPHIWEMTTNVNRYTFLLNDKKYKTRSQNKGQLYAAYKRQIQKRYKKSKKFKMTKTYRANTNHRNFNIKWKETQIGRVHRKKSFYIGKIYNP